MSANTNGDSDRAGNGQFRKGWRGGPGNPHVRKLASLRLAVSASVSPDDMMEVMAAMLEKAKRGDATAAHFVYLYTLGKPLEGDLLEKLAEIEAVVEGMIQQRQAETEHQKLYGRQNRLE